ncbi:MAG: CoA transferase, partial [Myxococcales bacterium]
MGPLKGVRVIELAGIGPGPYCGMLLSDLGAEVVRVDRMTPGMCGGWSAVRYDVHGRGRRSIALDLKQTAGVDIVMRLLEGADALIEGFRPGVAERLGIGPQECMARNPRLVYGRMTGWGQTGPLAEAAGHDVNYISLTGVLHAIGRDGEPPTIPLNVAGDFGGGAMFLALGVVAALFEASRSGRGQVVDAAMVDGASSLISFLYGALACNFWNDRRQS